MDSALLFLNKGLEEKTKGRRLESMKYFEKAATYNKNDKKILSQLAASYVDLKRYGPAREKYLQLANLGDPPDSTFQQLMLLSFNMRIFDDAIKYAKEYKLKDPTAKVAYYIGKANYEKENLGEAIKYLDFAAKELPDNAEIPYTIARAYADMQNYKPAINYFQKAIKLNSSEPRWIYEMALIYYAIPDDKNALKYMLEAGSKGYKKDNEYLQNLGIAYINSGQFTLGIETFKDLLSRRPSDMSLLSLLAQACYDAKKYDEAINYWDQVLKMDNKNADALYMIGMSLQKNGQKEKGIALCDKAIQMDPNLQSLKQKKQLPGGF
ncbi:MAG: hypothetical protein NVS1B13_21800 [Flavisolibacter sp.]